MLYTAKWEIEVDAETPEEAYKLIREIMLDPESTATLVDFTDELGNSVTLDEDTLALIEP